MDEEEMIRLVNEVLRSGVLSIQNLSEEKAGSLEDE